MVLDAESNIYIVASAKKGTDYMYCAMRFDTDGNIDWVSFENFGNTFLDWATDIATDLDGAAYVTGRTFDGTISSCMTIKYDSSGEVVWSHKILGIIPPPLNQKVRFYNGNVYILTPHSGSEGYEFLLRKLNADGDSLWQVTYPGTPYLLIIDSFENVFVSGLDSTGDSTITIKYSQVVGISSIGSSDNSLKVYPNPFHTTTSIQIPSIENPQNDLYLEIYDVPGKLIWNRRIHQERNIVFNRAPFENGMYILKLISDHKIIATTKIVIQ